MSSMPNTECASEHQRLEAQAHHEALRISLSGRTGRSEIDEAIRAKAGLLLVDTIACTLAGRQSDEVRAAEQGFAALGGGPFSFPSGPTLSVQSAAAIAAMACAWDEACEGLPYAHGRPGLALVGALLPLAVVRHTALGSLLDALHLGYEMGARAGGWLRIRRGMHVDGNWPAVGVAAGAARLMELPADQIWHAMNIAACQLPSSLYAPIRSGDMARNTYLAHVAQLGLLAAGSAAAGITAPDDSMILYALDHAVPCQTPVPDPAHDFLLDAYLKPHAGVRHAHYGLEAAIQLHRAISGDSLGIESIQLQVYEEAATYAGNRAPLRPLTGQFSLSLAVAAGLRFGEMGPECYRPERFFDPELRRLEAMTEVSTRAELGEQGTRAAILRIVHRGRPYTLRTDSIAGGPERPLTQAAIVEKFITYAQPECTAPQAREFAKRCLAGDLDQRFDRLWWGLNEPRNGSVHA